MALSRPLARLLRATLVQPSGPLPAGIVADLTSDDLQQLPGAAWFHGITGYVYRATRDLPQLPPQQRGRLAELRLRTVRRHLRTIGDLRFLAGAFDSAGIPWLVIKGPTLAEPLHGSPELRSYNDLDVLVPPEHFGRAVQALEAAGCRIPAHNWPHLQRTMRAEIDVALPSGTHLDLHWHLLIEDAVRSHFAVAVDELFERQRKVAIGTERIGTLGIADTCVYVALHAALSGSERLIGAKDLQLLLAGWPTDATAELRQHAQAWRADLAFRAALTRMERALGIRLPAGLEASTAAERAWQSLCRGAWRVSPLERQDGSPSLGRMVSGAVRGDLRRSATTLVDNARVVARGRLPAGVRGEPVPLSTDLDDVPAAALRTEARDRYLAAVGDAASAGRSRGVATVERAR
jgi:hypothetical protein